MKIQDLLKNIEEVLGENLLLVHKANKTEYKSEKVIGYVYKILLIDRKYESIEVTVSVDSEKQVNFKDGDSPKNIKLISPSMFAYSLNNTSNISISFKAEGIELSASPPPTAPQNRKEVIANV